MNTNANTCECDSGCGRKATREVRVPATDGDKLVGHMWLPLCAPCVRAAKADGWEIRALGADGVATFYLHS